SVSALAHRPANRSALAPEREGPKTERAPAGRTRSAAAEPRTGKRYARGGRWGRTCGASFLTGDRSICSARGVRGKRKKSIWLPRTPNLPVQRFSWEVQSTMGTAGKSLLARPFCFLLGLTSRAFVSLVDDLLVELQEVSVCVTAGCC